MRNTDLYERDFYAWATEQAALLRSGRVAEADLANIAEEIESMGRSEKRELVNRLAVLLAHLLKWQYTQLPQEVGLTLVSRAAATPTLRAAYPVSCGFRVCQPARRGTSWRLTIEEQRQRLATHLGDNPSLRAALPEWIAAAYGLARLRAARQTGRAPADFPADCAWAFEQIMDDGFWPEVSRQVVED